MKTTVLVIVATLALTGCLSTSQPVSQEPNYVESQIYQSPAPRNDNFGGGALPSRIGGPQ